jgi:hypothetical protein
MTLPQSIAEMADMFGYEPTMQFVRVFGGRTLYDMPGGKRAGGPLTEQINEIFGPDAKRFMAYFASTDLYVPRCWRDLIDQRDRAIQADYDAGMSVSQLVTKYQMCDRGIFKRLKRSIPDATPRARADDSQLDMFNTTNG